MNIDLQPADFVPEVAGLSELPPSRLRRVMNLLLGKGVTLVLATGALGLGIATFVLLSGGNQLSARPGVSVGVLLANVAVFLLLVAVLAGRLTRVWVERRRGSAGSRMHVRLVLLFSVVAVTPAIVVAVFAALFFNLGIQSWFNDRVRTALEDSLSTAQGYLEEHRNNIRGDALSMANDLSRAGHLLADDPNGFAQMLATQTFLRGLTEAVIFEPVTGQRLASAGVMVGLAIELPPREAIDAALNGDVAVIKGTDGTSVRAVVQLNSTPALILMIGRPIDPDILAHMSKVENAVAEYERLDQNRSGLQITFVLIFGLVALLVLAAAVLIGLVMANTIARPIGGLITAAERVRAGDLSVRVPEVRSGDEVAGLLRAFNRMTGQLAAQRSELMDAYSQIDERRRFTETVLSGVSAGVIGLDAGGHIELPNRAASELLAVDLMAEIGRPLEAAEPAFAQMMREARELPERALTAEIQIGPPTRRRTLLVRIGPEVTDGRIEGFVVTFDDITELQSAQRKAAWGDVARRIAHEIKNPLTPIQLSAERLKKRFTKEITSDPETFAQCADTIVRHVGEIGRMVDEFSAFARMPQPVMRPEDIGRIVREALVLPRTARPDIAWHADIPERGPVAPCDRRLLGQAVTNLVQNAVDSVSMHSYAPVEGGRASEALVCEGPDIAIIVTTEGELIHIAVSDNGVGLPEADRARLMEPYVTHKPKGTGLGLAIVKKIMEDHGGDVTLSGHAAMRGAAPPELAGSVARGAIATLILPARGPDGA
jgi:two-component system nitrogen regulation sensor histidine kinase NtrY